MERKYRFPVWGTQGGGLVREFNGTYFFVEKPKVPGLDVGDEMPKEWDLIPANDLAREADRAEQQAFFNAGVDELFQTLERMGRDERMSFFPTILRG